MVDDVVVGAEDVTVLKDEEIVVEVVAVDTEEVVELFVLDDVLLRFEEICSNVLE